MTDREKAPKDGVYLLGKGRFKVRAGQLMPAGATFVEAEPEADAATGNKGKPSETTEGDGPSETDGA